jgi:uncharacterized protein (DUF1778 family)
MDKPINIRVTVTESEHRHIHIAAAHAGLSIREFVKQAAIEKARNQMDDYDRAQIILNNAPGRPLDTLLKTKSDTTFLVMVGEQAPYNYTTLEALAANNDYDEQEMKSLIWTNAPHCIATVAVWRARYENASK